MQEGFTETAKQAVAEAQKEARLLQHDSVGREHLLYGIAAVPHSEGQEILHAFGLTAEKIHALLSGEDDSLGIMREQSGSLALSGPSLKTKEVFASALRTALNQNAAAANGKHLLLALFQTSPEDQKQVPVFKILTSAGINKAILDKHLRDREARRQSDHASAAGASLLDKKIDRATVLLKALGASGYMGTLTVLDGEEPGASWVARVSVPAEKIDTKKIEELIDLGERHGFTLQFSQQSGISFHRPIGS